MSKKKIYIDGQSGTTGLQIYGRIGSREDLTLMRIPEEKRHDTEERRRYLNGADLVFLCLPDEGAREAVSLIENPDVRVIDASTAHRTSEGWVYGYPELRKEQREAIRTAKRVANPGCHATGFISTVAPLVAAGLLPKDGPLTCFSLTGYTGGGKKMIAEYEGEERDALLSSPALYGLSLSHKHLPEMQKVCGLSVPPVFVPVVDDYDKGMATTVLLPHSLLSSGVTGEGIWEALQEHYEGERFITVHPYGSGGPRLYAGTLRGSNRLEIFVNGNGQQTIVTSVFDNLGKGASGAAVQNMNLMLGLDEGEGLL